MKIVKKISEIKEIVSDLKKNKKEINFIPTMGNIHPGHLSLISEADKFDGTNIISIFVNPAQFNDRNDFNNYPNAFEKDIQTLKKTNCKIIFAPSRNEIYPQGINLKKIVFKYRNILCDVFRLGHFDGVTTIVEILLDLIKPSKVFFGEKDFQQLKIIEQLLEQRKMNINLIKCPSIRDLNSMSLSSRYSSFSKDDKLIFKKCSKIITSNLINIKKNFDLKFLNNIVEQLRLCGVSNIDYCEVRDEDNLNISNTNKNSRLFIAFYLNKIRVIDNFVLY